MREGGVEQLRPLDRVIFTILTISAQQERAIRSKGRTRYELLICAYDKELPVLNNASNNSIKWPNLCYEIWSLFVVQQG
jgi:hypothetical protein